MGLIGALVASIWEVDEGGEFGGQTGTEPRFGEAGESGEIMGLLIGFGLGEILERLGPIDEEKGA